MKVNSTLILSVAVAAVLGFLAARMFVPNNGTAYDRYGLCIIQCADKADASSATLEKCLAGLPEPNFTVCEHVADQNKSACYDREIEKYLAIKKCEDAYDDGMTCRKDCRKFRIDEVKQ